MMVPLTSFVWRDESESTSLSVAIGFESDHAIQLAADSVRSDPRASCQFGFLHAAGSLRPRRAGNRGEGTGFTSQVMNRDGWHEMPTTSI